MRSDRLLATLLLLQTHGRLPAPEIARRLEVSTRTVHRDVEALSAAGVPVYTERGRAGGVALLPGYRTDVTGLTDDEMGALLGVAGADERGLGPATASAVRKLLAAVPAARRERLERSRRRLLVESRGWRRGEDEVPALPAIEAVLAADERLRLHYRSSTAPGPSWRTVDPYGLVSKAGTWYLVAAHRGRARMYRVSRVLDAVATGTPARRPDDRSLEQVWAQLRDRLEDPGTVPVTVRLRLRASSAVAVLRLAEPQLAGPPEEVGADGDHVLVDAPFRAAPAVRVLLGFGDAVEVLAPPEVRADVADAAESAAAVYR